MSSASSEVSPPLRVALAAGGTGGHLMPALATAEALAARTDCEFLVVGSPRGNERELRSLIKYPVVEVRARPLAGTGLLGKLRTALELPGAILRAHGVLRKFRPDLVIATGGYVCGPTGLAGWLLRTPLLVLEQNAVPGMTTRLLRPFARAVGVSFSDTARLVGGKAVITGNPMRTTLPGAPTGPAPGARDSVHLLILGGSQGARGLNSMIELAIPLLAESEVGLTVTHQTGKRDVEPMREAWAQHGIPATVVPFINSIGEAYARANLVCSRAGATTCAELAYCGLPSILVPYPAAAARHQHDNARAMVRGGAAIMVEEAMNGLPLAEAILELARSPDQRLAMGTAAAALRRGDAAQAVAELALSLVGRSAGRRPSAGLDREQSSAPRGRTSEPAR